MIGKKRRTHPVIVTGDNAGELERLALQSARELWGGIPCAVKRGYVTERTSPGDLKKFTAVITVVER